MDIYTMVKDSKTGATSKKGFTFATPISDEAETQLREIRAKARQDGKIVSNQAIAESAIAELHAQYVGEGK